MQHAEGVVLVKHANYEGGGAQSAPRTLAAKLHRKGCALIHGPRCNDHLPQEREQY
jgi:hypothetical protein